MVEMPDLDQEHTWLAARLPGKGRLLPATYRVLQWGTDGAAYMRNDAMTVIVSGEVHGGQRWLHVSCARRARMPSWEDLKEVKEVFVGADEYAVTVFPPREKYVNVHPFALHLYSCADGHPLPEFSGLVAGRRSI